MSQRIVYLDNAATTEVDPRVIAAMTSCLSVDGAFANPASLHSAGRASARLVASARTQVAKLLGAEPACLIWTSGATESDNLAIVGAANYRAHRGRHLITMKTEHKAVADTFSALEKSGFEVTWLSPQADGRLSVDALCSAIRADTQLVSIMHVNNETGVIQEIREIGEVCRRHDVLFHTDAAQSVGKLPINLKELPVDLLSLTAHKFHGPQGIGALYIADRPGCEVWPIMYGGGQERRLRPGTLALHQIAGIGAAAALAATEMRSHLQHVIQLRDQLWRGIQNVPGLLRNGNEASTYPGILNVSAAGVDGESLMLGMEPVCVASGSACNESSGEPSYVLRALGRDEKAAQSAIRFSFGRMTTESDIEVAIDRYCHTVKRMQKMAPQEIT